MRTVQAEIDVDDFDNERGYSVLNGANQRALYRERGAELQGTVESKANMQGLVGETFVQGQGGCFSDL